MALDVIESKGGITRIKAKSTDVIRVNFTDTDEEKIYVNNGHLGIWYNNNPSEDTQIIVHEDIEKAKANADMNIIMGTTDVIYFE